jgi:O-antigen/teichoic acid export membrane protein
MSIKRQTLWSLAPLVVTAAVAFFSAPLFVRYLGTEMYAMFLYVTGVSAMFGFADLGLGTVVGRNISMALGKNDLAAVRRYWGTGNLIVLPVLILVTLGFIGLMVWLGPLWFDKLAPTHVGLFRACLVVNGLGLFFAYYGTFWLAVSQAYLDFKFIGLIRAVVSPLQIIPSVLLAGHTHNPFWVLAWGTLVVMVQLGILIWHARRHYSLGLCLGSARLSCAREMAGYTAKMIVGLVMGAMFAPMVPSLLGRLATTVAFVPYGLSNNIAARLQSLSVAVMGPVLHNTARVMEGSRVATAKIYNDSFAFMFDWYLLAVLWLGLWHPILLRAYLIHTMGYPLGQDTAVAVGPLLIPLVLACAFSAMSNISTAQLTSINRLGTTIIFSIAAGLLSVAGVLLGWRMAGMLGAVYGYLFSRIALVAQDLYTIRLIRAGGWLDPHTWWKVAGQSLVATLFALVYLVLPRLSYWLLIPAALHGGLVAAWLLRQPLRRFLISKSATP